MTYVAKINNQGASVYINYIVITCSFILRSNAVYPIQVHKIAVSIYEDYINK